MLLQGFLKDLKKITMHCCSFIGSYDECIVNINTDRLLFHKLELYAELLNPTRDKTEKRHFYNISGKVYKIQV